MEEIVAKKNEGQEERVDKMMFKSLKKIKLEHLPMLSGFYTGDFPFECPSLEELIVRDCPKMKTSAATTPKLKAVILDNFEKTLQGMDLNQVVQNHFKAKTILSLLTILAKKAKNRLPKQGLSHNPNHNES
ncbi:hypothetical protein ACSBR1_015219 [Camellia fascicularis]